MLKPCGTLAEERNRQKAAVTKKKKEKEKGDSFADLLRLLPTSPLEVAASFSSTIPMVIAASGTRLSRKQTYSEHRSQRR